MPLSGYRKPVDGIPASDLGPTAAPSAFGYLSSGHETMPRWAAGSAQSMTSGVTRITYFTARASTPATSVRFCSATTAAGATPTLVRAGLYSVNTSTGDLTQIAATPNDTSLLATLNTEYTKAFSSATTVTAGLRYALAFLVVTGATVPNMWGVGGTVSAAMAQTPRLAAALTSQSDLSSPYTSGSLVATNTMLYAVVVP